MRKIALLTSGGDSPGMNAAIRSVVRGCLSYGIEPYVVYDGYKGLVEDRIEKVSRRFVSETINRGGTIIGTARYLDFKKSEVQDIAVNNLKKRDIDSLVVIGGDGSFRGTLDLERKGIKCIGIAGTIDNDINTAGYTLGFDTALNTIVDCLDKIRDTSSSHHRCSIVEVMGRYCGDLALFSGLASGADIIITGAKKYDLNKIYDEILEMKNEGRRHVLVVISENVLDIEEFKKNIEEKTGFETRASVLGQIQRGGKPSAMDRVNGSLIGFEAVRSLKDNKHNVVLYLLGKKVVGKDLQESINTSNFDDDYMYEAAKKVG